MEKAIEVNFHNNNYTFFTNIPDIVPGDTVIIDSEYGYRATIVTNINGDPGRATGRVIERL